MLVVQLSMMLPCYVCSGRVLYNLEVVVVLKGVIIYGHINKIKNLSKIKKRKINSKAHRKEKQSKCSEQFRLGKL